MFSRYGLMVVVVTLCASAAQAAPAADAQAARTLSSLVAIELARDARLDVLSSADLREVVALEGEKQALGCEVDSSSCLAEVAGAMGARFVVIGQLGVLAETLVLTLSLYDSDEGRAPGRVVVKGADAAEIGDGIPAGMTELVGSVEVKEGEKARLLVLDIKPLDEGEGVAIEPEPVATEEHDGELPLMLIGGGSLAALGAVGIAGGAVGMMLAVVFQTQAVEEPVQTKRAAVYNQRDFALWGGVGLAAAGGVAIAGGVGLAVFHLIGDRD
jgi:hypothetical protein